MVKQATNKPQFDLPMMSESKDWPSTELKVASTFSGCGGSSLGYRMAGFAVIWANEFSPEAQKSYAANKATECYLDCRDIKDVRPGEILDQIGMEPGELDVLDGSPPCQAFSTAGKREDGWGKQKVYGHGVSQCNETLFDEYIRLLRGLRPKVFVAENVGGLAKGKAKGFFLDILAGLKDSGYKVRCQLLDAQWLGVPQQRQRVIFIGVRDDLDAVPEYPKPLPYRYSVIDALPLITEATNDPKGQFQIQKASEKPCFTITASNHGHASVEIQEGAAQKKWRNSSRPSPPIMASSQAKVKTNMITRKFTIAEVARICSFPEDFVLVGSYTQQWRQLGNCVPPVMMKAIAETIRDKVFARLPQKA